MVLPFSNNIGFLFDGRCLYNSFVAENAGIPPDIEVRQDAKSLNDGKDPQLERAVLELMNQLGVKKEIKVPPFKEPAKGN